jgi:hypothetical protein
MLATLNSNEIRMANRFGLHSTPYIRTHKKTHRVWNFKFYINTGVPIFTVMMLLQLFTGGQATLSKE